METKSRMDRSVQQSNAGMKIISSVCPIVADMQRHIEEVNRTFFVTGMIPKESLNLSEKRSLREMTRRSCYGNRQATFYSHDNELKLLPLSECDRSVESRENGRAAWKADQSQFSKCWRRNVKRNDRRGHEISCSGTGSTAPPLKPGASLPPTRLLLMCDSDLQTARQQIEACVACTLEARQDTEDAGAMKVKMKARFCDAMVEEGVI